VGDRSECILRNFWKNPDSLVLTGCGTNYLLYVGMFLKHPIENGKKV
jgi:hypothetical protein